MEDDVKGSFARRCHYPSCVSLQYKDIISEKCLEKATKVRDYIIDK